MSIRSVAETSIEQGRGILRLAPTRVPRSFCVPGRRIKLHPADYYAMGGIDERWFSSTTPADNGPKTSKDEGLSLIIVEDGSCVEKVTLHDGQLTMDEFFVTEEAAQKGVVISNPSRTDPIVMLKHFGPENPDLAL